MCVRYNGGYDDGERLGVLELLTDEEELNSALEVQGVLEVLKDMSNKSWCL